MVIQRVIKSYPLLRIALIVSVILVVVALFATGVVNDPDGADITLFLILVGVAVALPFLALAWKRRETIVYELPSDRLAGASKKDLQGMLAALESAKEKGEISEERYAKARDRIKGAMAKR